MALVDLVNRFDDISIDFFNGDLELLETVNALEDLSEECESCLDSTMATVISKTEIPALAALLTDITNFEESLLDASSLSIEDSFDEEADDIGSYNDYYLSDFEESDESNETSLPPVENIQYVDDVSELDPSQDVVIAIGSEEEPMAQFIFPADENEGEEDINFATDKDYDKMRKQWVDKREAERKSSQKTEKETPLEERYKAAMTAFKNLQDDDSQAWKLEDEAHWLVDDLDRWTSEALEWRDIFTKYYNKLAKEIQKRADKIADKYDTPITEEDINIEEQIDNSEEVSEEEAENLEADLEEERPDETEQESTEETTEQESEQTTEEGQTAESKADEAQSTQEATQAQTVEEKTSNQQSAR